MSDRPPEPDPEGQATPDPTVPIDSLAPSGGTLGPFLLRELIGSGGMGEVWKAEQTSPVRRTVALKLIKAGMDSREVLARFEAERQALALMDHPSIAKVFDAGTTPQGRPWFAMEYVQGVPITDYCDRRRLSMVERLQLFQRVCEGVQHAHQKAVLHRDLKPGNVLVADVDGTPLPKIIDFGVAKATTQKLTEKTMYTAMGQLIGTPEYMSPEQAELTGEDVDTRTDVYSLGVILYELLVGALPFESTELRKAGFEGIRKMIREEDPPRPSTKLSTLGEKTTEIAAHRRSGPKRLSSQLKGDLDWIVMRCLEKDRNRRYGSPQELGQDIGRHLNYEPVQAGPPSAGYKARKFVRRNRLAVGIGAAAMIVLVGFTAMTVIQSSRIAAERDRANQEAEASERVSSFLAQMFADVDPYRMGSSIFDSLTLRARESRNAARGPSDGPDEPVEELRALLLTVNRSDLARDLLDEEILARSLETIEKDTELQPAVAARIRRTVGTTYRDLGLHEPSENALRNALTIYERELGPEHPETLTASHELGVTLRAQDQLAGSASLLSSVVEARRRVLGSDHLDTAESLFQLGLTLHSQLRYEEMYAAYAECLAIRESRLGMEHRLTLFALKEFADGHDHLGRPAKADSLATLALSIAETAADLEPLDLAEMQWGVMGMLRRNDHHARAAELARKVVDTCERIQGKEHPRVIGRRGTLASILASLGRTEEAIALSRETMEMATEAHGERSATGMAARASHAAVLWPSAHQPEEARRIRQGLLVDQRQILGEEHPDTIQSLGNLGWICLFGAHEPEEAARYYEEAVSVLERSRGAEDLWTINMKHWVAVSYTEAGRLDEAEPLLLELIEVRRRVQGETHERTGATYYRLGNLYLEMGRDEDAKGMHASFVEICRLRAEADDALPADLNNYACLLLELDGWEFGLDIRDPERALHFAELANEKTDYANPDYLDTLALTYSELGRLRDAIELERKALSLMEDGHRDKAAYQKRVESWEAALHGAASN